MTTDQVNSIIFDFDGVIAETEQSKFDLLDEILASHGFDLKDGFTLDDIRGISTRAFLMQHFRSFGFADIDQIIQKKKKLFYGNMSRHVVPYPQMRKTLEQLNQRFSLAIVSTSTPENLDALLTHLDIRHLFEWVFGQDVGADFDFQKSYHDIPGRMGRKVEECIVVEDSEYGVRAATAAGYRCIRFDPEKKLNGNAEGMVVTDYFELKNVLDNINVRV